MMVVKTKAADCIGAFANDGFAAAPGLNADAFVFTFTPQFASYRWVHRGGIVVAVTHEEISISGAGAAAIWIDNRLLNGFSERCDGFQSPPLTTKTQFQVGDIEIWAIGV
jgi:hypothetical protein